MLAFVGDTTKTTATYNGFTVEPPDQGLCAGGGWVIEATNVVISIRNQNTPATVAANFPKSLCNFYRGVSGDSYGDPRCVFIPGSNVFVVTSYNFNGAKSFVSVAVSPPVTSVAPNVATWKVFSDTRSYPLSSLPHAPSTTTPPSATSLASYRNMNPPPAATMTLVPSGAAPTARAPALTRGGGGRAATRAPVAASTTAASPAGPPTTINAPSRVAPRRQRPPDEPRPPEPGARKGVGWERGRGEPAEPASTSTSHTAPRPSPPNAAKSFGVIHLREATGASSARRAGEGGGGDARARGRRVGAARKGGQFGRVAGGSDSIVIRCRPQLDVARPVAGGDPGAGTVGGKADSIARVSHRGAHGRACARVHPPAGQHAVAVQGRQEAGAGDGARGVGEGSSMPFCQRHRATVHDGQHGDDSRRTAHRQQGVRVGAVGAGRGGYPGGAGQVL